jgi:hypothetical protein
MSFGIMSAPQLLMSETHLRVMVLVLKRVREPGDPYIWEYCPAKCSRWED